MDTRQDVHGIGMRCDMAQAAGIFHTPAYAGSALQQNFVAAKLVDDVLLSMIAARISRLQNRFSSISMMVHSWMPLSPSGRLLEMVEQRHSVQWYLPHVLIYPNAPSQQRSWHQAVFYLTDRYKNLLQSIIIKMRRAAPFPPRGGR